MNLVARNALALYGAQFAVRLFNVAVVVLIGRLLGPADLGRFSFVMATVSFVHQFAVGGLNVWLTREVARDESRAAELLARALALNVVLAAVGCLAIEAASLLPAWVADPERNLCLRLFVVSVFFSAAAETVFAVFDGRQDMRYRALAVSIRAAARAGLCAVLLLGVRRLPVLFVGYGLIELLVLAAAFRLYVGRFGAPHWAGRRIRYREVIAEVWPFLLITLLALAYLRVHVWLLTFLRGNQSAGIFAAAQSFILALLLLPGAVTNALFPQLSQLATRDAAQFRRVFRRLLRWVALGGALAAVAVCAGAGVLIALFFGPRYAAAAAVLRILAWTLPTGYVQGALVTLLYATGRQRQVLKLSLVTMAICAGTSWWLVHRLDATGAAWGALIADVCGLALFALAATRGPARFSLADLWKRAAVW